MDPYHFGRALRNAAIIAAFLLLALGFGLGALFF